VFPTNPVAANNLQTVGAGLVKWWWWWWWWYGSCCSRNLKAKAITRRWDDSQYALLNSSVFRRLRNWGTVSV